MLVLDLFTVHQVSGPSPSSVRLGEGDFPPFLVLSGRGLADLGPASLAQLYVSTLLLGGHASQLLPDWGDLGDPVAGGVYELCGLLAAYPGLTFLIVDACPLDL